MPEMAYLVGGDKGEYSDHCSWYVKVFLVKSDADALCERLNAWCREMGCDESKGIIRFGDKQHPQRMSCTPPSRPTTRRRR
jgi:hypothetical protein